jgi:copper(I)-binding protein
MYFKTALTLVLLIASTLLGSTLLASAHEFKLGDLVIGHPWSRATPGGAKVGGGYLTITNNGSAPDKLLSATTAAADHVEIHEMATKDGVMTMRHQPNGVTIEPGKTVAFAPGGYHLMLMGLKGPLKEGDRLKATLAFEKAGPIDVTINVEGIGAQHPAPAEDHSQHKM